MLVVFDMDGTLSDDRHRLHLLPRDRTHYSDYQLYNARCSADPPIAAGLAALAAHALAAHRVEIWTGRAEEQEAATRAWLSLHLSPHVLGLAGEIPLRMRARCHDGISTTEIKRAWLRGIPPGAPRPLLAYDDRPEVAAMWREEGVACFQIVAVPKG